MPANGPLRDKLIREAEALSRNNPYVPYGHGFKAEAQRLRESKVKPDGALPLSITGKSPPENFSSAELYDIATNERLAKKIFREYTGKDPSPREIASLRERITETYPEIQQYGDPDTAAGAFNKAYDAMGRRNNPDVKPIVDFFVNNPEIAGYGGHGVQDNELLQAAQQVKQNGYQPSQALELIKSRAELYRVPSNQQYEGQPGRNNFINNIDKPRNQVVGSAQDRQDYDAFAPAIQQRLNTQKGHRLEDLAPRVKEASRLEKLATSAERNMDRIAPLGDIHEEAKDLLKRNLNPESLNLAKREIQSAGRTDVVRDVAPYLNRATESPDAFISQYENKYDDVIQGFRREAAKDFLEHDMPAVNRQYASKGAFYSGAREAALDKARANKEERIEREVSRLKSHGRDEAMKHYNEHRRHMLSVGEVAGKTSTAKQDASLRGAEASRLNAMSENQIAHQNVTAMEQLGRTEQEQAQNALNVRLSEYREQQERPWEELQRKSAIAAGHPLQPMQYSPQYVNPTPPNVYGLGAGLLGQMAGLQRQGAGAPFRKGGHVRSKYADGGSIARTAAELKQIQQHTQEPNEHEQEMLSEARNIGNNRIDPMGRYLFTLGSHQIANNREDPLKTYGEGSLKAMEAHDQANVHNLSAKQKYVNLLGKINDSRSTQQKFFSKYHLNKMANEETARAHHAHHAETRRYHDLMHQEAMSKNQAPNNPNALSFASKEAEKAHYKRDLDLKKKFDDQVEVSHKDMQSVKKMQRLVAKGIGDTGTIVGRTPESLLARFYDPQTIARRRLFEKEFTTKVQNMLNSAKGTQTDADREYMARTTVSLKDDPVTIKAYLKDLEKVNKRSAEAVKYIEDETEKGVSMEQAQKQWRKYIDAHPLFEDEEGPIADNGQAAEDGELVKMIGPDGSEAMVPRANVQESINMGARLS